MEVKLLAYLINYFSVAPLQTIFGKFEKYHRHWLFANLGHTIIYHTILYYTILCYTILYYTILYYTIFCCTILWYAVLNFTVLYYTILYYTTLYYTILLYTVLCYAKLCYTKFKQSNHPRTEDSSKHTLGKLKKRRRTPIFFSSSVGSRYGCRRLAASKIMQLLSLVAGFCLLLLQENIF